MLYICYLIYIRRLQDQIVAEKKKISNCIHDYNEPFFNPDTIREAYGYNMVGHGSDVWYEPQGYRDVKVDRWTRVCKICGNSQHTNKLEPVIKEYKPKF